MQGYHCLGRGVGGQFCSLEEVGQFVPCSRQAPLVERLALSFGVTKMDKPSRAPGRRFS